MLVRLIFLLVELCGIVFSYMKTCLANLLLGNYVVDPCFRFAFKDDDWKSKALNLNEVFSKYQEIR